MTPRTPIIAVAASLFATAAIAGSFEDLDTDGSGGLSLSEVQAAAPSVTATEFAAADVDASGELSRSEYAAWASKAPSE